MKTLAYALEELLGAYGYFLFFLYFFGSSTLEFRLYFRLFFILPPSNILHTLSQNHGINIVLLPCASGLFSAPKGKYEAVASARKACLC